MRHDIAIRIRRIESGDHAVCARIHTDAWNAALPALPRNIGVADFRAGIESESTFVASAGSRVVGYISVCEDEGFVHHLYVDPVARRGGVGTALLSHVGRWVRFRPIGLKCLSANVGALEFHEASGFVRASETGSDEDGDWVRLEKVRD